LWTVLVYTVPAKPTRKRAAVWREVKRLGALYLRDGVCALPDTAPARTGLQALAERVLALDGEATLIWEAQLTESTSRALHAELTRIRQAEYAEAAEVAAALLQHLREEAEHHGFKHTALTSVTADLGRLQRWLGQIVACDYLQVGDPRPIAAILTACRALIAEYGALASRRAR